MHWASASYSHYVPFCTLQVDFANAIHQRQNQLTQQRANGQELVKCAQEKVDATVEVVTVHKDTQDNVVKSKCQDFAREKMTKHAQVRYQL